MDAGTLHRAIAEVCPVAGTTVVDADDRSTWSFMPGEGATQPQIDAGNNVIATIAPESQPAPPAPAEDALYDHESRILVLEGQPPMDVMTFLSKRKLR